MGVYSLNSYWTHIDIKSKSFHHETHRRNIGDEFESPGICRADGEGVITLCFYGDIELSRIFYKKRYPYVNCYIVCVFNKYWIKDVFSVCI